MEYERIHKVQVGVLSPTKLRMKLLGSHNRVRTSGVTGTSSSRSSPSKIVEPETGHNSLLLRDTDEEESSRDSGGASTNNHPIKEIRNFGPNYVPKCIPNHAQASSLSTVHPIKTVEEDKNQNRSFESGHDNGNGCNFEFHHMMVERIPQNPPVGNFCRPAPSKWNNAEKWVLNRQNSNSNSNALRRLVGLGQSTMGHTTTTTSEIRVTNINSQAVNTKRIEGTNPANNGFLERFSFQSTQQNRIEAGQKELCAATPPISDPKATPIVQPISTRDFGTEMTPIPSQDPSRICTPLGSVTPVRSPNSSIPSTPFGEKADTNTANTIEPQPCLKRKGSIKELSENELIIRTRKEIAALGVQLGKMRIASWASKGGMEMESSNISPKNKNESDEAMKRDYETRAVAWQEAENSRHDARFKREEVKIQAWESEQRAKFEAEMLKIEAKAERMRAEAVEKMTEKIEITRQTAEEKRAAAEARMNKLSARAAHKAQIIRQTGRIPSSHGLLCCSGFFRR